MNKTLYSYSNKNGFFFTNELLHLYMYELLFYIALNVGIFQLHLVYSFFSFLLFEKFEWSKIYQINK